MKLTLLSALVASLLFVGCGSSDTTAATPTSATTLSGNLIDSYLENVDYVCGDGTTGVTDERGAFSCVSAPITFRLGGLKLGTITTLPSDGFVFPQEILGHNRTDVTNTDVIAMAQFLQSCDSDGNVTNGLSLETQLKEHLSSTLDFSALEIATYAYDANISLIDAADALAHLQDTLEDVTQLGTLVNLPTTLKTSLLIAPVTLSQDVKNTLAYMGNEERLAYDVYNYLYAYHNNSLMQLHNVATKSESTHIQTVQFLVRKYISDYSEFTIVDRNESEYRDTAIADMVAGAYDIQAIQDLYDALIAKGVQSPRDALEVGCMVEVTDINDLVEDIEKAKDANATDIVTAFEFLRDGSYNHYWAFDKGLKNMGVSDGCCALGAEYCHPEYPQAVKGNGNH